MNTPNFVSANSASEGARVPGHEPWPRRALYLFIFGAVLGLAFDALIGDPQTGWSKDVPRLSLAFAILTGGITFGLTVEKLRSRWSLAFAAATGLVIGAVFYWNGSPDGWRGGEEWQLVAAFLSIVIAAPLFQSARDAGRLFFDYASVHTYAWGNVVLWGVAWGFVLIVYLLSHLIAELFSLIGITLPREALRESWLTFMIIGAALGAAFGLLRDRDQILGTMLRVGMAVLSVLTPILAIGLLLFVFALPFTGLTPLWEQTKATTPILLGCVIGALILANASLGKDQDEEAKKPLLRYSAMSLSLVILPLSIVALISTWLRIHQYGYSPTRLWGLVFVSVFLVVALAYFASVLRGRLLWGDFVRRGNILLAIGICTLALLLATPLIDFGAISTRNQVARLESGEVALEEFDWPALRYDFGPSGLAALQQLQQHGSPIVRTYAAKALQSLDRSILADEVTANLRARKLAESIRVVPAPLTVPRRMQDVLAKSGACASGGCTLFWKAAETEAVAVGFGCPECLATVTMLRRGPKGEWLATPVASSPSSGATQDAAKLQRSAIAAGRLEVRPVTRRQVFINGEPVATPF